MGRSRGCGTLLGNMDVNKRAGGLKMEAQIQDQIIHEKVETQISDSGGVRHRSGVGRIMGGNATHRK